MRFPLEHAGRRAGLLSGAALAPAACCCLALAACGSGSSPRPTTRAASTSAASSNRTTQQVKFAVCMRQHGVPISDPTAGPQQALTSGVPAPTLQAAIAACRQYAVGALSTISASARAAFSQALVKYAICLRANGIDIPDPAINGDKGFGQKLLAAESLPNFKQANATCRRKLPPQFGGAAAAR